MKTLIALAFTLMLVGCSASQWPEWATIAFDETDVTLCANKETVSPNNGLIDEAESPTYSAGVCIEIPREQDTDKRLSIQVPDT